MMKFEVGVPALKKMVLYNYNSTLFADNTHAYYKEDEVEAYFYLTASGEPVFCIEENT